MFWCFASPLSWRAGIILEQLLVSKILYFCFVFSACSQVIYKHLLSRSFLDRHLILWDRTSHVWNIYECNTKSYLRHWILSNEVVCFSSMVFFPALIFCLFFLKCSDKHSDWLHFETSKCCIEKDKTSETVFLGKVSSKNNMEMIEGCSKWKYIKMFWCPYWWLRASVTNYPRVFIASFEHYLYTKSSILLSIVFIKQIFFIFLVLLTSMFFFLYFDCSKYERF